MIDYEKGNMMTTTRTPCLSPLMLKEPHEFIRDSIETLESIQSGVRAEQFPLQLIRAIRLSCIRMVDLSQEILNETEEGDTFDFGDGNGLVAAHRHKNPNGSIGGWVANTAQVSGEAEVSEGAWIFGEAWISGKVRVSGEARIFGKAQVSGEAWISGKAQVFGEAEISGKARVCGEAEVFGEAWVSGKMEER